MKGVPGNPPTEYGRPFLCGQISFCLPNGDNGTVAKICVNDVINDNETNNLKLLIVKSQFENGSTKDLKSNQVFLIKL